MFDIGKYVMGDQFIQQYQLLFGVWLQVEFIFQLLYINDMLFGGFDKYSKEMQVVIIL